MNMIERRRRMMGQGGFTLIELLVVIAILGILAGVVVFAVGNSTENAATNACKVEKRTLQTAIQAAKASENASDTWEDYTDGTDAPKYWAVGASPGFALTRSSEPAAGCS